MKFAYIVPVILCGLTLQAERVPYERYQTIVNRQMFGAPPPGFDPTKPPSEVSRSSGRGGADAEQLSDEQREIKSAIHFSVINVTPGGETAVGFTDNGDAKNPVHYYLKVGETRNGWTVKSADAVKATMTIAKGEIEVSLSIGDNSAKGGGKKGSPRAAAAGNGSDKRFESRSASLRSRRLMRRQQLQEEAEQERKKEEAEKRAKEERAEKDAQRDAQLQGLQEELLKMREANAAREAAEKRDDAGDGAEGGDE